MTLRSRIRIRNPFHRHNNPGNVDAQAVQGSSTINSLLLAPPDTNQATQSFEPDDLWLAAYNQLGDKERRVLSTIQLSTTLTDGEKPPQTTLFISEVIQLTEKQYESFQQGVDGRFRESSQKIINAALSFKDIIGAVAASDPTQHAASAWAIVSLGLTVCEKFQVSCATANL
jgi:hypothetical protein